MSELKHLFQNNQEWVDKLRREDPDFFTKLSNQQNPEYLWIGCSDSRVPANQIIGLLPGDIFVHRNVANQVIHTDFNCLSVIQYAVEVLKVRHIIVCGHIGCGGVKAAIDDSELGLIDNWLAHIKYVHQHFMDYFERISNPQKKWDIMCKVNVMMQVRNVAETTILKQSMESRQDVTIHGWIYKVSDGLLQDLHVTVSQKEDIAKVENEIKKLLVAESD